MTEAILLGVIIGLLFFIKTKADDEEDSVL